MRDALPYREPALTKGDSARESRRQRADLSPFGPDLALYGEMGRTVAINPSVADTFEAVYAQEADRLWRALFALSADTEIASDAVAEAFAQAMRRGTAIRDPRGWVWKAGFRIATGELKRRSSSVSTVPEGSYLDPEADTELLGALAQLPVGQRAAVILHYYADAPVSEISRQTGMSQLSVRANLSRGRKRLRQLLGERHG
jgi:RNA polymerase sigma factor (sigma-70 family)